MDINILFCLFTIVRMGEFLYEGSEQGDQIMYTVVWKLLRIRKDAIWWARVSEFEVSVGRSEV